MKKVVIETARNKYGSYEYAVACWADSVSRRESAMPPVAMFADGIRGMDEPRRVHALGGVLEWYEFAHVLAVYDDLGITAPMKASVDRARSLGQKVEYRSLGFPYSSQKPGVREPPPVVSSADLPVAVSA